MDLWSYMLGKKHGGGGSSGGGGAAEVNPNADVRYLDYDGTVLYSYSAEEALVLTEAPPFPERKGLICQGWNVSLENMQSYVRKYGMRDVGAYYITDDGKTRLYIRLENGRTSPMLGLGVNGTVTVDWGDGSTPDVLTGTSTSSVKWTSNHEYGKAGDYVITLTVDGEAAFKGGTSDAEASCLLRYSSSSDYRNFAYCNALRNVEIGSGINTLSSYSFSNCFGLKSISISNEVLSVTNHAFYKCYGLTFVSIPERINEIWSGTFTNCYSLASVALPDTTTRFNTGTFTNAYGLKRFCMPQGGAIYSEFARYCVGLSRVAIPDNVTTIGSYAFSNCSGLTSVVVPSSVAKLESYAFSGCQGVKFYDFTSHTAIPSLAATNALNNLPADCEIRVPAALVDEWKAATNWATYAGKIVGV